MIAPEVNLIREDDREMYFAHRPLVGIVFLLIGMGAVYFFAFHVDHRQLVVRSDKLIMHINEQKLSPKEQEWLKVAVSVIVNG